MLILNGAIRRGGVPAVTAETGRAALFTFVCICVSLLLIPHPASSQCVGRVLSEEGDAMAAGGEPGWGPARKGCRVQSEACRSGEERGSGVKRSSRPKGRGWEWLRGDRDWRKAGLGQDEGVSARLWRLLARTGSVAPGTAQTTPRSSQPRMHSPHSQVPRSLPRPACLSPPASTTPCAVTGPADSTHGGRGQAQGSSRQAANFSPGYPVCTPCPEQPVQTRAAGAAATRQSPDGLPPLPCLQCRVYSEHTALQSPNMTTFEAA